MHESSETLSEAIDGLVRSLPRRALENALQKLEPHDQEKKVGVIISLSTVEDLLQKRLGDLRTVTAAAVSLLLSKNEYKKGDDLFQYCSKKMKGIDNPFHATIESILRDFLDQRPT